MIFNKVNLVKINILNIKKIINLASKAFLLCLAITITLIIYVIVNPPSFLLEQIKVIAEQQILKNTGLYAKIDHLSDLHLSLSKISISIDGIKINKSKSPTSQTFLKVKRLDASFTNIFDYFYLAGKNSTVQVNIYKPEITLARKKGGQFDLDTFLLTAKKKKKDSSPVKIPKAFLKIDEGIIKYTDYNFKNRLDLHTRIPFIYAEIDENENLKYNIGINENKDAVSIDGNLNINRGNGSLDANVSVLDISKWIKVFYASKNLELKKGDIDLKFGGNWDNFKLANLKFDVNLKANEILGKLPYFNDNVNIKKLRITTNQNDFNIKDFDINFSDSELKILAQSTYNSKPEKTNFRLSINSDKLDIKKIVSSLDKKILTKSIRNLNLAGILKTNLVFKGHFPKINNKLKFIGYPSEVAIDDSNGNLDIFNANVSKSQISQINTKFTVDKNAVHINKFSAKLNDGSVNGQFTIKDLFKEGNLTKVNSKQANLLGSLDLKNLNLNSVLNDYKVSIPNKYKPSVRTLNSSFLISGKLINPIVNGSVRIPLITFNKNYSQLKNINNTNIKLAYSKDLSKVKTNLNSNDFGNLSFDVKLKNQDFVSTNINLKNLNIKTLEAFVPKLNINSGTAKIYLQSSFSLKNLIKNKKQSADKLAKLITGEARVNISNTALKYNISSKKSLRLDKLNSDLNLKMRNGFILSKINLNSEKIKNLNVNLGIKNLNEISSKISMDSFSIKQAEEFVPNLEVKSGYINLFANIRTNLKDFKKQKITLDRLTYMLKGNSHISLKDVYLKYTTPNGGKVNFSKGIFDLLFKTNNGLVNSDFYANSKEFGESKGFINVDEKRYLLSKISNKYINLTSLNKFVPRLEIKKGFAIFELLTEGNIKDFEKNKRAIKSEGFFIIKDFDSKYANKNKIYPLDANFSNTHFKYNGGDLDFSSELNSNSFGRIQAKANIYNLDKVTAKFQAYIPNLKNIDKFVKIKNVLINKGSANINANFDSTLSKLKKDSLKFNSKGSILLNNFNATYSDSKIEDGETIKTNYPQNLDKFRITFNWKNGLLDVYDLNLKNASSEILGTAKLDINLLKKDIKNFGDIKLKTNNFILSDFPILKMYGVKDGVFEYLNLNASISKNIADMKVYLDTKVKNISVNNSGFDLIKTNLDIKNNLISLNNFQIVKDAGSLESNGFVNITNLKNPTLNLKIVSQKFAIKNVFKMFPNNFFKNLSKSKKIEKLLYKDNINVKYTLPAVYTSSTTMSLNDTIDYWQRWSLEPLTDKTQRQVSKVPNYWEAIDGNATFVSDIKGTAKNPDVNLNLVISSAVIYEKEFNEIYADIRYKNKDININKLHLIEKNGGYLKLNGSLIDNKLDFEGDGKLNLDWGTAFTPKTLSLNGDTITIFDIKGTTSNPNITISVDVNSGTMRDVYFDKISLLGTFNNNIINVVQADLKANGKEANVSGVIPLNKEDGSMNITAKVEKNSLELANLFTNNVQLLNVDGDLFLNAQGSLNKPIVTGKISINDGQIFLPSINKNFEKTNLDISLSNYFIKINTAQTYLNDRKIDLLGQIDLIGFKPGFLKLKVVSQDFNWEQDNMNITADLSLKINNTIDEPLIGGKVIVKKGQMSLALKKSKKSQKTTSSRVLVKYNNLSVDIPKDTDFWVNSPFFDLRPFGSIKLKKGEITDPVILGYMEIDRGSLYVLNNEFTIKEARADFDGNEFERDVFPINPKLMILAETKLNNPRTDEKVTVEAKITGDMSDIPKNTLKFTWTDTGSLSDSEIWEQVIGASGAQEVAKDPSKIAQFATPYFNRAIFNPLTSKIAEFLSLDQLNVGIATDTISSPGVSMSFVKPIWGGISLGYDGVFRQRLQYDLFLKYRLNKNFSLKTSIDEMNSLTGQVEAGFTF